MATIMREKKKVVSKLNNGDHMSQKEFHRLYKKMPTGFLAELSGGIVFVSSPLKRQHGTTHIPLSGLLCIYLSHTPGVGGGG